MTRLHQPGLQAAIGDPGEAAGAADDGITRRGRLYYRAFVLPALVVVAFVAIIPLGMLVYSSFVDEESGRATVRYYVSSLASPFFMRTLGTTVAIALGVTAIAILLALPLAYVLARRTLLRGILIPIISVPRMLPFVVIGYAMVLLLAPYTGALNKALMRIGILSEPTFILFDWPGQALAFAYAGVVIAVAILTGVLMTVDPQLEDTAVTLGAGRLRAILTVTVPLSVPGIVAASALIFSTVVTAYSIPVMLNSRTPYMVSVLIYSNLYSLQARHLAYAQAVIVSVLAVGVMVAGQLVLSRFGRRR